MPFAGRSYYAGRQPSTPSTAPTLREAVYARLLSTTAISAVVGSRIYFGSIPESKPLPAVSYFVPSSSSGHVLAGADGVKRSRVQISAWAWTQSDAVKIAEAVRDRFDGYRGAIGGVEVLGCLLEFEGDLPEPPRDGSDGWIYQTVIDYQIAHRIALPALLAT